MDPVIAPVALGAVPVTPAAPGSFDLSPAPGRYPFPLGGGWTAVVLVSLPGFIAVGLFLDGEPVEVIDDQEDARGYLEELLRARFSTL